MAYKHGNRGRTTGERKLIVLVDMDNVMCDFEGYFIEAWRRKFPDKSYIPLNDRRTFYLFEQYDPEMRPFIESILKEEGHFHQMPPLEGAVDAVKEISGMDGVEVFLCTSPLTLSSFSTKDKFDWVVDHMGRDWVDRLIMLHDKTLVLGDILIDDKWRIKGVNPKPSWEHILFTACHNKHLALKDTTATTRLESWTDEHHWKEIISEHLKKKC